MRSVVPVFVSSDFANRCLVCYLIKKAACVKANNAHAWKGCLPSTESIELSVACRKECHDLRKTFEDSEDTCAAYRTTRFAIFRYKAEDNTRLLGGRGGEGDIIFASVVSLSITPLPDLNPNSCLPRMLLPNGTEHRFSSESLNKELSSRTRRYGDPLGRCSLKTCDVTPCTSPPMPPRPSTVVFLVGAIIASTIESLPRPPTSPSRAVSGRPTVHSLAQKQSTRPARISSLQLMYHEGVQPQVVRDNKLSNTTASRDGWVGAKIGSRSVCCIGRESLLVDGSIPSGGYGIVQPYQSIANVS